MSQIKFIGDSCLNTICSEVDLKDLRTNKFKYVNYVDYLFKKMKRNGGCGIAAPQIGDTIQLAIVVVDGVVVENDTKIRLKSNKPFVIINPVMKLTKNLKTNIDEEGCLSIPNKTYQITRYNEIVVEYYNLNGEKHSILITDYVSRVFQHEIDHLLGITIFDREKQQI